MNAERVRRALEIVRGHVVHAPDPRARSEAEEVLDVLASIVPDLPARRCDVGPEQCDCWICWPQRHAA